MYIYRINIYIYIHFKTNKQQIYVFEHMHISRVSGNIYV